jgi:hypothetical protein
MNCEICGRPLPDGARFCPNCGAAVGPLVGTEERKMVPVLFADIVDSTGLGGRLDPERSREPLVPCTFSSRPGLAFSSRTAAVTSLERMVVFVQRLSVSVVDATYLGFVFNAVQIGLSPGSSHVPQEPAKIS